MAATLSDFNFTRFAVVDLHGTPRGKVMPKVSAQKHDERGFEMFSGVLAISANGTIDCCNGIEPISNGGFANSLFKPDLDSLRALPWVDTGTDRPSLDQAVGSVFCDGFWKDGRPMGADCRQNAKARLSQLQEHGFQLLTGFEVEFQIVDKAGKPIWQDQNYSRFDVAELEPPGILYKIAQDCEKAGISIDCFHYEYFQGQVEIVTSPCVGIQAADNVTLLRSAVRENLAKFGLNAVFLSTKTDHCGCKNGTHMNQSLWRNDDVLCVNEFTANNGTDSLSAVGRKWLAGQVAHGDTLTAFFNPTVNCYRRIDRTQRMPTYSNWQLEKRTTTFRVKGGYKGTYIENRLGSGVLNPYVALATSIAAGLDGIVNNLVLGPAECQHTKLPNSLQEALKKVRKDEWMRGVLGSEFCDWWDVVKQDEVERLGKQAVSSPGDDGQVKAELQFYKNV